MPRAHAETQVYFTSHLREVIKVNNLTIAQVVRDTGLGQATIFRYMKPRPTLDAAVCQTLLRYFNLNDISELFSLPLEGVTPDRHQ